MVQEKEDGLLVIQNNMEAAAQSIRHPANCTWQQEAKKNTRKMLRREKSSGEMLKTKLSRELSGCK